MLQEYLKVKNAWTYGRGTVTVQNLEVVQVDTDNNVILVKGNVPGPKKVL